LTSANWAGFGVDGIESKWSALMDDFRTFDAFETAAKKIYAGQGQDRLREEGLVRALEERGLPPSSEKNALMIVMQGKGAAHILRPAPLVVMVHQLSQLVRFASMR
jgi:hypothetical protein